MSQSPSELIDEELSAYLDGELTPVQSATLEKRLVDDEGLRKRLAELRQANELLDELPETPHKQSFTQSTIAMVVEDVKRSKVQPVRTSQVIPPKAGWFGWPKILLPLGFMLVLGGVFGSFGALLQTRFELSNLTVIANLPGLQDIGEWKVAGDLSKDPELLEYLTERYSDRMVPPIPDSLWSRRSWVHSLNPAQIARLDNSREQLLKLPRDNVVRLEAIQSQIDVQPDAVAINQAIRIVGLVMDALPNTKRQDLEGLTAEQRVRFLRDQLHFRAAMFYAADLTTADTNALDSWSRNELLPVLVANMPFLRREVDVRTMLMSLYSLRPIEDGFRLENQDELVANLAEEMSPFARKLLEGVDRRDQLIVISTWLVPEGINNVQRLIDTYDRIRRDSREELDLLDPNQSKRILRDRSRRPSAPVRPR
jgi:hypothetical protein